MISSQEGYNAEQRSKYRGSDKLLPKINRLLVNQKIFSSFSTTQKECKNTFRTRQTWEKEGNDSPRNSNEGSKNLLEALDCRILEIPDPRPPTVDSVLNTITNLQVITVPSTEKLLTTSFLWILFPQQDFWSCETWTYPLSPYLGHNWTSKNSLYTDDVSVAQIRMTQLGPPEGYESMEKIYPGTRVLMLLHLFT